MRKFQFLLFFLLGSSSIADDVTQFTHNGVKLFLEEHSYFLMHLHVTKYLFHARCKFIKKTSVIYIYIFFFNRRYSLLSFRLSQRILIHINSETLPITYSEFRMQNQLTNSTTHNTLLFLCSAEGISFTQARPGIEPATRRPIVTLNRRCPPKLRHNGGASRFSYTIQYPSIVTTVC